MVHVDRLWRHPGEGTYTWESQASDDPSDESADEEYALREAGPSTRSTDAESDTHNDSSDENESLPDYHCVNELNERERESIDESDDEEQHEFVEREVNLRPRREVRPPKWLQQYVIDI